MNAQAHNAFNKPRDASGRFVPQAKPSQPPLSDAARLWRACRDAPPLTEADLPAAPATPSRDAFNAVWKQADDMEKIAYRMKMLWDLLYPELDGAFGMAVGPYNFVIEGTPEHDQFRVLSNEQSELLFHHLGDIGAMIEELDEARKAS